MPDGKLDREYEPSVYELISLNEAAGLCELSADHLRRLARDGEMWAIKPGWEWLTTAAAVNEYLARDIKPGPKGKRPTKE